MRIQDVLRTGGSCVSLRVLVIQQIIPSLICCRYARFVDILFTFRVHRFFASLLADNAGMHAAQLWLKIALSYTSPLLEAMSPVKAQRSAGRPDGRAGLPIPPSRSLHSAPKALNPLKLNTHRIPQINPTPGSAIWPVSSGRDDKTWFTVERLGLVVSGFRGFKSWHFGILGFGVFSIRHSSSQVSYRSCRSCIHDLRAF